MLTPRSLPRIHLKLQRDLDDLQSQMDDIQKNFKEEPLRVLAQDDAVRIAAKHELWKGCEEALRGQIDRADKGVIKRDDIVPGLIQWAQDEIMRRADTVPSSTSQSANLVDQYKRMALVRLYKTVLHEGF